jgi:hypothetical protein
MKKCSPIHREATRASMRFAGLCSWIAGQAGGLSGSMVGKKEVAQAQKTKFNLSKWDHVLCWMLGYRRDLRPNKIWNAFCC